MNFDAEGTDNFFWALKMVNFFFTKCMANDDFSEPPRHADSKNLIFIFFAVFWVRVSSGARGSVSVGFRGACQFEPFWEVV